MTTPPQATATHEITPGDLVLSVRDLKTQFPVRSNFLKRTIGHVHAVDGVDLDLRFGETLGLVGESGCGKSTLARTIMGLVDPAAGSVYFAGENVTASNSRDRRTQRRQMQMVFQDPVGSLDPRQKVKDIVAEPLIAYRLHDPKTREERVLELLELVGLEARHAERFPHEFSGGQRQRIGIARALALNPKLLVLDEPVSALDVSIQAQILNLLQDLQIELGLSYLLISHDLAVVRHVAHHIAVMYLGRVVERGTTDEIFANPRHPYTKALLSAVPNPDPSLRDRESIVLEGDIPSPINPPSGCRFRTRCPIAADICSTSDPMLEPGPTGTHQTACHFAGAEIPTAT
jgi:oligopeptide/dipeptide ABC transporter ATP-binding protein